MQQGPFDPNGWGAVVGQPGAALLAPAAPAPRDPRAVSTAPLAGGASWYSSWAHVVGPPSEDDREKAFLAHLLPAIASLVCLGVAFHILAALLPRALTKSNHPFLLFHVGQSFAFHGGLFVLNMVLFFVFYVIGILTCGFGFVLLSINVLIPLVSAGYGFYMALAARSGGWNKYPIAGDRVWAMSKPLIP